MRPRPERHKLLINAGLTPRKLELIGAIAVLSAHTEQFAEQASWALGGAPLPNKKQKIESLPVSVTIERLSELAPTKPELTKLIEQWCRAATYAFSCRNSIVHGFLAGMGGEWTVLMRNQPVSGVRRSKDFAEFHATENTLELMEEAFTYLLDGIHLIRVAAGKPVHSSHIEKALGNARRAWSIAAELDDLAAAVNHEKY